MIRIFAAILKWWMLFVMVNKGLLVKEDGKEERRKC